jgi:CheY-like chemotaxis protein
VLLVEDDEAVRLTTRRILESVGYKILEAATAREAKQVWETSRNLIDLVLTDLLLPGGVTGRELAESLRADQPELKVIFMSGYSPDMAGKDTDFFRRTKSHFLQKPCASKTLIRAVRSCLDDHPLEDR